MTRINCIPPSELSDKHLGAEYRELPRVFGLALAAIGRGELPDLQDPAEYTLGRGHVRFFYPRLRYLRHRYAAIVEECYRRRRHVSHPDIPYSAARIPPHWWNDWTPTPAAQALNRTRIRERTTTR